MSVGIRIACIPIGIGCMLFVIILIPIVIVIALLIVGYVTIGIDSMSFPEIA